MPASDLTRLQRVTYRVWLGVGIVLLTGVAFWLLARPLAVIIPPLLVAAILVYLLNPIVSGLHRLHVPRLLGTLIAFALFFGGITAVGFALAPPLVEQVTSFAEVAPELGEDFGEQFTGWLAGLGITIDMPGEFDAEMVAQQVQDFLGDADARAALLAALGGLSGVFIGMFNLALALIVGPFVAGYLLWDLPRVRGWAYRAIPPDRREEVTHVARRLSGVVGGFIRGQLIVAAYVGVATSIALALIGLPFWLVLGVVAGIVNIIPFIGPFVAGLLGVLVALFTDGVGLAIAVVVVMTIVQQGDNQVVSPLVMGRTVRLHPLVVLLALLVAGTMYGVFGLLLAVPVVAAGNVLLGHFWATRVPWAGQDGLGGEQTQVPPPTDEELEVGSAAGAADVEREPRNDGAGRAGGASDSEAARDAADHSTSATPSARG